LGGSSTPLKFGSPKTSKSWCDFPQLHDLIVNISGTQQEIVNRKMAMQTADTPAQANLIWCTLVHKLLKVGLEFWPTQRVAIRLGIATHLVVITVRWLELLADVADISTLSSDALLVRLVCGCCSTHNLPAANNVCTVGRSVKHVLEQNRRTEHLLKCCSGRLD